MPKNVENSSTTTSLGANKLIILKTKGLAQWHKGFNKNWSSQRFEQSNRLYQGVAGPLF